MTLFDANDRTHDTRDPDPDPIAPERRAEIAAQLAAIEDAHGVRILYACESGSRGWGFASPDSDYDVRFLYVHPLAWYLRVHPQRDVIEQPIDGDLDINGWELRKALALLGKGNATLVEWLDSPIIYRADPHFLTAMREAARELHRPERSFHHYVHMARGNDREFLTRGQVRLKKYLYVLRPLLATLWIEQGRGPAPMRFETLVDALIEEPASLNGRLGRRAQPRMPSRILRRSSRSSRKDVSAALRTRCRRAQARWPAPRQARHKVRWSNPASSPPAGRGS
ncbi:nucleotidyltransferase domain-containing protein [Thiohalocapsa marina]|uniref:nucleotidyltransferase domain-containing protein n=1 Tax=Thiohalocapsa marina TaxID=424902 RepID=UPI001FE6E155|nr:nucleotidyltransferase domain-containing protein [Thiohalocapsa marina]